jgi:hypothetical protein
MPPFRPRPAVPRRRSARLAAAACAALLLAACALPDPGPADLDGAEPPSTAPTTSTSPTPTTSPESAAPPKATPTGGPWIASLGDSFISGEAGRWAGNSAGASGLVDALGPTAYFDSPDGTSELIPLCHRSKSAMVHIGDDGPPAGRGNAQAVGSTNLACSGAETKTFTEDGAFKPGIDFVGQGTAEQGQAALLEDLAEQRDVQLVLVSIGGNDFGFGGVIEDCLEAFIEDAGYCSQDPDVTAKIDQGTVKTITGRITNALRNVRQAMRNAGRADGSWTLVVNLNPDTLPLGNGFRYGESYSRWYDGGCGFYNRDAQWAGTRFVTTIRKAAAQAVKASGVTPAVTMDFSNLLDDRELCADGTLQVGSSGGADTWESDGAVDASEWADQVRAENDGPYFEQESLHPNYWAQLAMRSCVRQLYAAEQRTDRACVRSGSGLTGRGEPVVSLR